MLIKKADVRNHLAAKLKKRHMLQGSTIGQIPTSTPRRVPMTLSPPAGAPRSP